MAMASVMVDAPHRVQIWPFIVPIRIRCIANVLNHCSVRKVMLTWCPARHWIAAIPTAIWVASIANEHLRNYHRPASYWLALLRHWEIYAQPKKMHKVFWIWALWLAVASMASAIHKYWPARRWANHGIRWRSLTATSRHQAVSEHEPHRISVRRQLINCTTSKTINTSGRGAAAIPKSKNSYGCVKWTNENPPICIGPRLRCPKTVTQFLWTSIHRTIQYHRLHQIRRRDSVAGIPSRNW